MKIYTEKKYFKFSSELIILSGLLEELPKEPIHCYNYKGESRYGDIIVFCKKNIFYTDKPDESDFFVLPFKFKETNCKIYQRMLFLSKKVGKKLLCFYNDDNDKSYNLDENVILYRTSFYKKSKKINELAFPAFSPDFFKNNYLENSKLSVGFCGQIGSGRKKYLEILKNSDIETNFIFRKGFWAPGVDRKLARKEYFDNISNNLFTFCYRGGGNFSYRFYETLMMGRIPILVNTDCVFPFEDKININKLGIIIEEKDDIINSIKEYYELNKNNLLDIQKNNRKIWEEYYSPVGFIKSLISINS